MESEKQAEVGPGPVAHQPGGVQPQYQAPGVQYQAQGVQYQAQGQPYGAVQQGQPGAPQPGYQQVVVPAITPIPGCPPGLEYLTQLDQVLMRQLIEVAEILTGWEMNNKYTINNTMGQQIFYAKEDTDCMERQCCGPNRGFVMHLTDNMGTEVIQVSREFKCFAGSACSCYKSCDSCLLELQVEAPPGQVVGYVKQGQYCLAPIFTIMDAQRRPVFTMNGPACPIQGICCTEDVNFPVCTIDGGQEIGVIRKQWTGLLREMISDADKFGVTFPADLDVKMKATLIGLMFMVDFCFFERKQK